MRMKIRYANAGGFTRIENFVDLKEVMINEDFLHPENESIALGFRNKDSSGIIELTSKEFEFLADKVRKKTHLLKGVRIFDTGSMADIKKK
ncbi:hypothetical protein HYU50_03355 [Candidatus Woesearchaeota archaeon]|nr:hypothetical protein [Candidatus Woesearchaeota archaeon]